MYDSHRGGILSDQQPGAAMNPYALQEAALQLLDLQERMEALCTHAPTLIHHGAQ